MTQPQIERLFIEVRDKLSTLADEVTKLGDKPIGDALKTAKNQVHGLFMDFEKSHGPK